MGALLLLAVGTLVVFLRAKVLQTMWGWFLVPLGLDPLTFGLALGIMFTWGMINGPSWEDIKEHDLAEVFTLALHSVIQALIALGAGWLVQMAMGAG